MSEPFDPSSTTVMPPPGPRRLLDPHPRYQPPAARPEVRRPITNHRTVEAYLRGVFYGLFVAALLVAAFLAGMVFQASQSAPPIGG